MTGDLITTNRIFNSSLVLLPLPALGDDAAAAEEAAEDSADADEQRHRRHEEDEPPLAAKLKMDFVICDGFQLMKKGIYEGTHLLSHQVYSHIPSTQE